MVDSKGSGSRVLRGFIAVIAWFSLFVAFVASAATITVDNLDHAGNAATSIVEHLTQNPATVNSLLEDLKKNADPKTVAEIEKNRSTIDSTIASLGGDKAFQDSLAAILNKISEALLNGATSVKVDFTSLAAAVADKVNATSGTVVISKKELAKLKPQVLDLSKQSKNIAKARSRIKEITLTWLIWLLFLGLLYLLKKWKVVRTAGWQLLSVGSIFLGTSLASPLIVSKLLDNSTAVLYQKDLGHAISQVLVKPMLVLSIVSVLTGLILVIAGQILGKRTNQISPSEVA